MLLWTCISKCQSIKMYPNSMTQPQFIGCCMVVIMIFCLFVLGFLRLFVYPYFLRFCSFFFLLSQHIRTGTRNLLAVCYNYFHSLKIIIMLKIRVHIYFSLNRIKSICMCVWLIVSHITYAVFCWFILLTFENQRNIWT